MKKRVGAYCRISTNLEMQQSSLEVQKEAFQRTIAMHEDWEFVKIYADAGLTGTSTEKRKQFQQMMQDARDGKLDYILAKSISRFARNTLDTLKYTRELKEMGVGVYFEEQALDTLSVTSEIFLTIHAAFAQEESRSISENMKLAYQNRFSMGIPKWSNTYGYIRIDTKHWEINPDEAVIIQKIFDMFLSGMSLPEICTGLKKQKIAPPGGKKQWHAHSLSTILHNEKYIGDVAMQKSRTTDHLTHKRVLMKPIYYTENHHEGIIEKEKFELVQRILKMKDAHRGAVQYPYYGLLKCPFCDRNMVGIALPTRLKERGWFCPEHRKVCIKDKYLPQIKSYIDFTQSIDEITFSPDYSQLQIVHKNGIVEEQEISYERLSEYPVEHAEIRGEDVYLNGEKYSHAFNDRMAVQSIQRVQEFLAGLVISEIDDVPIVKMEGTDESKKNCSEN